MKLAAFEVARAAAALLVVVAHLAKLVDGYPVHVQAVAMLSNLATEAVILFFVLSGAVITLSQESRPRAPIAYLAARLRRIYPTYLVALVLACLAAAVSSRPMPEWSQLAGHLVFLQSLNGWIVPVVGTNDPLWTLGYEAWFYIAFVVLLVHPRARWAWFGIALAAGAITYVLPPTTPGPLQQLCWVAAFSLYWLFGHAVVVLRGRIAPTRAAGLAFLVAGFLWSRAWAGAGEFYDLHRWVGFALGAALFISSLLRPPGQAQAAGWNLAARAACIIGAILVWQYSASLPLTRLLLLLLGAAAIFMTKRALSFLSALLHPLQKPLVWVGGISYGIYALHFPLIIIVNHALGDFGLATRIAVSVSLTILAAWVVDAPARRGKRHVSPASPESLKEAAP